MAVLRVVLLAAVFALAAPVAASAGTVSRSGATITVTGASTGEAVSFATEGASHVVTTSLEFTGVSGGCVADGAQRAVCTPLAAALVANMQGGDATGPPRQVTGAASLRASGGAGDDNLDGTANADTLSGQDGADTIYGYAGNDSLDGGAGNDFLYDGPGNDTVVGGSGDDVLGSGPGADRFSGGDGADTADYSQRSAPVTVTLLGGAADDGEPGERDNIGPDV
jgi:Ca2+-binding RTX toxin-like protein